MFNINDDSRLFPQITFRVNTIRLHDVLSWPQPDSNINNIINNLKSQTVWVPHVPYPLKHGDIFSLYGKRAIILHNEYKQINATSNLSITLDLLYFGPPIQETTTTTPEPTTTTTTPEPTTTTTTLAPTTTTTTPEPTTTSTTTPEPTTTTTTPVPTTTTTTPVPTTTTTTPEPTTTTTTPEPTTTTTTLAPTTTTTTPEPTTTTTTPEPTTTTTTPEPTTTTTTLAPTTTTTSSTTTTAAPTTTTTSSTTTTTSSTTTTAAPSPTDPTLQIWYDGTDSTQFVPSPTNGSTFTQWTDKSAAAHNANSSGGTNSRPIYNTNIQNGLSAVYFDGVNRRATVNPFTDLRNLQAVSLIWVGKTTSLVKEQQITGMGIGTTSTTDFLLAINSGLFTVGMAGGIASTNYTLNTNFHIHTLLYDGTQSTNSNKLIYRIDGTQQVLTFAINIGTATSNSTDTMYLGMAPNSTNFFEGYMGEVLVYTVKLNASQVYNTENYLANKYNIILG